MTKTWKTQTLTYHTNMNSQPDKPNMKTHQTHEYQVGGKNGRKFQTLDEAVRFETAKRAQDGIFRNIDKIAKTDPAPQDQDQRLADAVAGMVACTDPDKNEYTDGMGIVGQWNPNAPIFETETKDDGCLKAWARKPATPDQAPRKDRSLEHIGGTPDEIALALHNDAVSSQRPRETDAGYQRRIADTRKPDPEDLRTLKRVYLNKVGRGEILETEQETFQRKNFPLSFWNRIANPIDAPAKPDPASHVAGHPPLLVALQEMADIAQDAGMHPDRINAVCDRFAHAQRLADVCKTLADFSFTNYQPQVALQLLVKIKRQARQDLAAWEAGQ